MMGSAVEKPSMAAPTLPGRKMVSGRAAPAAPAIPAFSSCLRESTIASLRALGGRLRLDPSIPAAPGRREAAPVAVARATKGIHPAYARATTPGLPHDAQASTVIGGPRLPSRSARRWKWRALGTTWRCGCPGRKGPGRWWWWRVAAVHGGDYLRLRREK